VCIFHNICIPTREFTHGKNNARIKSASNGPPTIPNILRAICRIRLPKYCDRKARAIVNSPYSNATTLEYIVALISLTSWRVIFLYNGLKISVMKTKAKAFTPDDTVLKIKHN